jgi:hypothetical protein
MLNARIQKLGRVASAMEIGQIRYIMRCSQQRLSASYNKDHIELGSKERDLSRPSRLPLARFCVFLSVAVGIGLGQGNYGYAEEPESAPSHAMYSAVAPGLLASKGFAGLLQPGVEAQVQDLIVGPQQVVPDVPVSGVEIVELRSGAIQITLDGKVSEQRPGSYWIVYPHQKYSLHNSETMALLHVVTLTAR